uniref:Putative secreted protein n=1 Tax=Anopheles darlingi TaxID=43151 RepID=A0A2M4DLV7_ANODA
MEIAAALVALALNASAPSCANIIGVRSFRANLVPFSHSTTISIGHIARAVCSSTNWIQLVMKTEWKWMIVDGIGMQ